MLIIYSTDYSFILSVLMSELPNLQPCVPFSCSSSRSVIPEPTKRTPEFSQGEKTATSVQFHLNSSSDFAAACSSPLSDRNNPQLSQGGDRGRTPVNLLLILTVVQTVLHFQTGTSVIENSNGSEKWSASRILSINLYLFTCYLSAVKTMT